MQKISIHRALTLIKNTEGSLPSLINSSTYVGVVQGVNEKIPVNKVYKTYDQLVSMLQSSFDKTTASFDNIVKLKLAIQKSNLETKVIFFDKEVSITELLAIKSTLTHRRQFINALKNQVKKASEVIHAEKQRIDSAFKFGDSTTSQVFKEQSQVLYDLQGLHLTTGVKNVNIAEFIEKMEAECNYLDQELDYKLSESNIITMIEVDL